MMLNRLHKTVLIAPLLLATILPANAQRYNNNNWNNGVRQGGRGGSYYNNNRHYDDHRRDQGGIGPGKGALIGGAGGAVLGAVFGGGLKGTIIGGAAGAGIGAVVGGVAQSKRDNNRRPYRR